MRFRDLPPIYARLGGFLAGSLAGRVPGVPTVLEPLTAVLPTSVRDGWQLARRAEALDEPPVLLVPGFMGPRILLVPLALFLRAHGRRVKILRTFPALKGVEASARRVARAIESLGAERIDLVAHSMGGLACRYYMDHLMAGSQIRRFVSIATPHLGTRWANIRVTQSALDMAPGNGLLSAMAGRPPAPGVRCYTIRAGWDQIVWPREHGRWDGHARDHELAWAEHWAVQLDPRTLALVLTLLEEPDDCIDFVSEFTIERPEQGETTVLGDRQA